MCDSKTLIVRQTKEVKIQAKEELEENNNKYVPLYFVPAIMSRSSTLSYFFNSFFENPVHPILFVVITISFISITARAVDISKASKTHTKHHQMASSTAPIEGECLAPATNTQCSSSVVAPTFDYSILPKTTQKSNNGGVKIQFDEAPILIGNTKNPTHLVTLVHGLGDSANGWRQPSQMLASSLPNVLFVLPTAPQQPVTVAGGSVMSAWFDVIEGGHGRTLEQLAARKNDVTGVLTSGRYVADLAGHIAFKHKIPTANIIFSGFSQGAAMSIIAALTAPYVPRAVMPLSGFFPAVKETIALAKENGQIDALIASKVPFRFFHGDSDQMLPLGLARIGAEALKAEGLPVVDFKVYKGLQHSTTSEELRDIVTWLKSITSH